MASERDLLMNEVHEREYLEIDAKVKFHSVISCIIKWQIASSEVSDEVYESNKEQYIMEAETLQSKLTEAYFRLETSTVYKLSSSEKKKREVLMEELSYEIDYLSNITPMQTACDIADAPSTPTEQVDRDQQSTALLDTDPTDRIVSAIDLTEDQDTATNSTGNPTARTERTDKSTINPDICVSDTFDDVIATVVNTEQVCNHVEPAIADVQSAEVTCTGYATSDTEHIVRVTEEPDGCTAEVTDGFTEELADGCTENLADSCTVALTDGCTEKLLGGCPEDRLVECSTEEIADCFTEEQLHGCTEELADDCIDEPADNKEEQEGYTEYTEQLPRTLPTAKMFTATNVHTTVKQTHSMIEKASTESDIAVDTDNGIKVWHHPQNTEETIETPESTSQGTICCQSDYSNERLYLLLYS